MKIKRNILLLSATELEHGQTYLFDHEIHITGIGKVKAAVETARLINEYKPDIVVNFGSCGAVKHLPIGDCPDDSFCGSDGLCKTGDLLLTLRAPKILGRGRASEGDVNRVSLKTQGQ